MDLDVAEVVSVDPDRSLVRVVMAADQAGERRLPVARLAETLEGGEPELAAAG